MEGQCPPLSYLDMLFLDRPHSSPSARALIPRRTRSFRSLLGKLLACPPIFRPLRLIAWSAAGTAPPQNPRCLGFWPSTEAPPAGGKAIKPACSKFPSSAPLSARSGAAHARGYAPALRVGKYAAARPVFSPLYGTRPRVRVAVLENSLRLYDSTPGRGPLWSSKNFYTPGSKVISAFKSEAAGPVFGCAAGGFPARPAAKPALETVGGGSLYFR